MHVTTMKTEAMIVKEREEGDMRRIDGRKGKEESMQLYNNFKKKTRGKKLFRGFISPQQNGCH